MILISVNNICRKASMEGGKLSDTRLNFINHHTQYIGYRIRTKKID